MGCCRGSWNWIKASKTLAANVSSVAMHHRHVHTQSDSFSSCWTHRIKAELRYTGNLERFILETGTEVTWMLREGCLPRPDLHVEASALQGSVHIQLWSSLRSAAKNVPAGGRCKAWPCSMNTFIWPQAKGLLPDASYHSCSLRDSCGLGAHFHDGARSSCKPSSAVKGSPGAGKFNSNLNL